MADLVRRVAEMVRREGLLLAGDTVVVGVSGGADSLCLLHILLRLAPTCGVALHVGHLNHGMRPESAGEAEWVRARCAAWGVPCTVGRADVPALASDRRLSLEECARQERYRFLGELAIRLGGRTVAVAHHADDQAETVLMHLLRGAGLAGLGGMRSVSALEELYLGEHPLSAPIRLVRPLLDVTRAEIEAYDAEQGLQPLFDRSNLDTTYFRNRLRHELLPALESYNPQVRAVLRHTAEVAAGEYDLLQAIVAERWAATMRSEGAEAVSFDLAAWRAQPVAVQRALLRRAVQRLRRSLRDVHWAHVHAAVQVAQQGSTGAQATLPGGLGLSVGYDALTVAPTGWRPASDALPRLSAPMPVALPGCTPLPDSEWVLRAKHLPRVELPAGWEANADPYTAYLDADALAGLVTLRPRHPGDVVVPLGLGHRQKLGDLLTNAKVPRAERDTLPLLVLRDEILWVAGVRVAAHCAIHPDTRWVYRLTFERQARQGAL